MNLNEAVCKKFLYSLSVCTVTLAALCLKEEMSQLNSFGRTQGWLLIQILSQHESSKWVSVLLPNCLFILK